jgi:hypothetical protein
MTNDDIEQVLGSVTPGGLRAELRPRVLAAVATELRTERTSPWLRRAALAVAASLLVSLALNLWASHVSQRRLARLLGPPPVSRQAQELAQAVEEISDAQTAQWVYQQYASPRPSEDGLEAYAAYRDMVRRLIEASPELPKELYDETPQEDSQMDRDRSGRAGGDRAGGQRLLGLEHRYTA